MFLIDTGTQRRASRRRRSLAAGLENAVDCALRPRPVLSARIPVAADAVAACAERLLALAGVLRSTRPLPTEGERDVRDLLSDGAGPLYAGDEAVLEHALTRTELLLGLR